MRFRVRPSSSERAARTPLHLYDAGGAIFCFGTPGRAKIPSHRLSLPDPGPDGPESFVRPGPVAMARDRRPAVAGRRGGTKFSENFVPFRLRGFRPEPPALHKQAGGGGQNFQGMTSHGFDKSDHHHQAGAGARARGRVARHLAAAGVPHRREPTVWRRPSTPRSGRLVASQEQPPPGAGGAAASSTTPADYAGLGSGWDDSPSQRSAMIRAGGLWSRSCALTGIVLTTASQEGRAQRPAADESRAGPGSRPHIDRPGRSRLAARSRGSAR